MIQQLRRRYLVADKPDNALWHTMPGVDLTAPIVDQGDFVSRSLGFRPSGRHLADFFPDYIAWLRSHSDRTAMFGLSAEFSLFSLHGVPDVVFLFREPSDAYASWVKPERHKRLIDSLGGADSLKGISYYCHRWRRAAREYLRLDAEGLSPRLLRYEYVLADSQPLGLGWAYEDFRTGRGSAASLSPNTRWRIHGLLYQEIELIYSRST